MAIGKIISLIFHWIATFPLQRTSSAALRTSPQACLSHGLLALVSMMLMMMSRSRSMMVMVMMMMMKYQSSLW